MNTNSEDEVPFACPVLTPPEKAIPDTSPVRRSAKPHFENNSIACFQCGARPSLSWLGYCKACLAVEPELACFAPAATAVWLSEEAFRKELDSWTLRFGFIAIGFVDELLERLESIESDCAAIRDKFREAVRHAHGRPYKPQGGLSTSSSAPSPTR